MGQGKSLVALFVLAISSPLVRAQSPAQVELFEKNARPLFVEKCQGCHNAKLKSGGFDLSSPEGVKEAAASGIFGTAAEPEKSPILQALSYENRVKMPPKASFRPRQFPRFGSGSQPVLQFQLQPRIPLAPERAYAPSRHVASSRMPTRTFGRSSRSRVRRRLPRDVKTRPPIPSTNSYWPISRRTVSSRVRRRTKPLYCVALHSI